MAVTDEERPEVEADESGKRDTEEELRRAAADALGQLQEIRRQLDRLFSIQLDRLRLKLEDSVARMVGLTILAVVALTAAAVGMIYLMAGVAGGLSTLFGDQAWAGKLAAGGGTLLLLFGGGALIARRRRAASLRRLRDKYESEPGGDRL